MDAAHDRTVFGLHPSAAEWQAQLMRHAARMIEEFSEYADVRAMYRVADRLEQRVREVRSAQTTRARTARAEHKSHEDGRIVEIASEILRRRPGLSMRAVE